MTSNLYKYYQPNKLDMKDTYGDCVIRALTKAVGKDWTGVFDDLVPIARSLQAMPSGKPVYERYLINNAFTYHGISNKKGTKRPTVASFAAEHKSGIFLLRVANHVVTVVDGCFYDTFDCGHKSLYGYWSKEN